jgi:hypothetical protein
MTFYLPAKVGRNKKCMSRTISDSLLYFFEVPKRRNNLSLFEIGFTIVGVFTSSGILIVIY